MAPVPRFPLPVVPRRALFGNPARANPALSPDGTRFAFLAPIDGVLNLWVAPLAAPDEASAVTRDKGRGIVEYQWAYTGRHLIYLQDNQGDENWQAHCLDVASGRQWPLSPATGTQALIQGLSPRLPNEILLATNDREPRLHDVYRVDIRTGGRTLVVRNPGFAGFVTDMDLNVRLGLRMRAGGVTEVMRASPGGNWETHFEIGAEDNLTTSVLGFDQTGHKLYMIDSRGRNTAALRVVDVRTGDGEVLAASGQVDIEARDVILHPSRREVLAVGFRDGLQKWDAKEPAVGRDLDRLGRLHAGLVEIVGQSVDGQVWIAALSGDETPRQYYSLDRNRGKPSLLFRSRPALEGAPFVRMLPLTIDAGDGLNMPAYLSLPALAHGPRDGRPEEPFPTVLLVHGGPWARDYWGFNPFHQWLANRRYAVLSVNYRGSAGYGKDFLNAGNLEWGGKMLDDLLAAAAWAVREGIADPARIAIMGESYGGYAVLAAMAFAPNSFTCGVSVAGPSDLLTFLESIPPYWEPLREVLTKRVGDPATVEGRRFLADRSPFNRASRISRPILIGQGQNDPRCRPAESGRLVAALEERGVPVTYLLYSGEGHNLLKTANRLSFFAIVEAFFAAHLRGRCEPIGSDLHGSSVRVVAGASHIPGLPEALGRRPAANGT